MLATWDVITSRCLPSSVSDRRLIGIVLQEERGQDRCRQLWFGCTLRGQSGIHLLVKPEAKPTHQLRRNDGRFSHPKNLPASLKGAPYPCLFRQHDGGSLYKTPVSGHGPSTAGVPKLFHFMTHLDKYNLFHDPPKYLR